MEGLTEAVDRLRRSWSPQGVGLRVVRITLLFLAPASLTSHAATPDLFDGRWQLGDLHSVATDLQPNAANAGQEERLFGGDALLVSYAFQSRKWYANARYNRTDHAVRTGFDFSRKVGNNRSSFELGRSWIGHGGD